MLIQIVHILLNFNCFYLVLISNHLLSCWIMLLHLLTVLVQIWMSLVFICLFSLVFQWINCFFVNTCKFNLLVISWVFPWWHEKLFFLLLQLIMNIWMISINFLNLNRWLILLIQTCLLFMNSWMGIFFLKILSV